MWENTRLEQITKEKLTADPDILTSTAMWGGYNALKLYLCEQVLPNIGRTEPTLTDHSEDHIVDVQKNIFKIIEPRIDQFNPIELYFLTFASLIHDIGNIFGRAGHEKKALTIIKSFPFTNDPIKRIANSIAKAHGGKGDTIKKLSSNIPYENLPVKSQEIASIVRFADECAEGIQRCYLFGLENNLIDDDTSQIHHNYSKITNIFIDINYIKLSYHIGLEKFKTLLEFEEFLRFVFMRINKTNRERIYCSQYSSIISQYSSIDVSIELAIDSLEASFETINYSLNNMSMLECTSDPSNSDERIENILKNKVVIDHYEGENKNETD